MTTYIKAKLKKSDDQTKIYKYSLAANITECNFSSKIHDDKANVKMYVK